MKLESFPAEVIWSALSGVMVTRNFQDVAECINALAGGPVHTHEMPAWFDRVSSKAAERFPAFVDKPAITPETYAHWRSDVGEDYLSRMISFPFGCLGGLHD